jgi:hypothetical protein
LKAYSWYIGHLGQNLTCGEVANFRTIGQLEK